MCLETIRVKSVELFGTGRVRCSGTIHGAYLHQGPSRRRLAAKLMQAQLTGHPIEVEVVRGAIVKVYGRWE